jgi:hypothetical protein
VAFHADGADGVHLVASVDHRDSLWFGPKYYDLCYQHHGANGSTDATAIGRRSPAGASPVSIVSDGHGVALVTWIDEHHAFLARWVRLNAVTPTAAPSALDAEDPEVRAHCQARWPSTLSELQLSEESSGDPAMANIAAGEHVRDRIDGVRWDRAANHRFTSFAHLLEQPLGTVVITDKALYFTSDAPPKPRGAQANVARMELSSLRGTELQKFGRFHWLAIHRVDDNDEYVAGNDDEATREVATRLASLIAQPDAVGADP